MTDDQHDQRRAPRLRTLKSGRIIYNEGNSTIDCVIRNMSETGAQLKSETLFECPNKFELMVKQSDMTEVTITCEKAWQKNLTVGVRFIDNPLANTFTT